MLKLVVTFNLLKILHKSHFNLKLCLKNTKISIEGMNGETGDVANDNIIHVLTTNNQSNDQDSFNTYALWKEQKKERAKQSRSSSRGKINHLLDEIFFCNFKSYTKQSTIENIDALL